MAQQIISYNGDKRLVLSLAEAIRPLPYGSDWTRIRVGLHGSFVNASATITGTPRIALGICSGRGPLAPANKHVLGWQTNASSLTYNAGPPAYFNGLAQQTNLFRYTNTTLTSGSAITGAGFPPYFSADTSVRSCLFAEITRRSATSISFMLSWPFEAADAQIDISEETFLEGMAAPTMGGTIGAMAQHDALYCSVPQLGVFSSMDEATYGAFDSIFVYWDETTPQFSFNIAHIKVE